MAKTLKSGTKRKKSSATAVDSTKNIAAKSRRAGVSPESLANSFRNWHAWLAVVLALEAVAILLLGRTRDLAVTANYSAIDPLQSQVAGHGVLVPAVSHLFDINLAFAVAAFLLLAAVIQALAASVWRPFYDQNMRRQTNPLRWLEFALCGGLMVVAIGLVAGITNGTELLMLFGLAIIGGLLTCTIERSGVSKKLSVANWLVAGVAVAAVILPCLAIGLQLMWGGIFGDRATWFVYSAFATILIFYGGQALNLWLQQSGRGRWANYAHAERLYLILGLATESALAWQIFVGTLYS